MAPSRRLRLLIPSLLELPRHLELFPTLLSSLGPDTVHVTSTGPRELLSVASTTNSFLGQERPRPDQGGERITERFLRRLGHSECVWRFR